jgi:hypothetical protein
MSEDNSGIVIHVNVASEAAVCISNPRPCGEHSEFNPEASQCSVDGIDIYRNLAVHQRSEIWFGRDLVVSLQEWAVRFILEFKLQIPEVVLRIDTLPCTRYGHFRVGHNGFGLKGEIALNSRYINNREFWQILGTLLHELLHAWQHTYGNPSRRDHHNAEYRNKARECGLNIDERGVTGYPAESQFKDVLRRHGVAVPEAEYAAVGVRARGQSKMKKWSCGCTNVRCAKVLQARCLACGQEFSPAL